MLDLEKRIVLDKFKLRDYQIPIWDAIENKGYRKVLAVLPRRAGKDITTWNLAIRQALKKTCLVYYALPTYSQARKCIFDAIAIDGTKFLDFLPSQFVESINVSEMKIRFTNQSILQCIGADSYETSLVGTNPYAIVFSEWARCNPKSYEYARPILAANGGWCVMLTTPFGKNHAYQMWKVANELPDWYVLYKKTSQIQHISADILAEERAQMSPELYEQEYECSWDRGVSGAYYAKALDNLRKAGQICPVAWEPGLLVHVAIDIGVNDATTLIWFQTVGDGTIIRIIDCYSNTGLGIDHYAKILQDKPYRYGKYFAPADIKVREWGGGAVTRYEKARQLGITFTLVDQVGVMDGIENVWTHFPKFWIDDTRCRSLVNALENYYREWDEMRQIYKEKPLHTWASHYADCLRYMCLSIHKTKKGLTPEEFELKKAAALYGDNAELPRMFRNDPKYDRYR
jgi:hypothetical protein